MPSIAALEMMHHVTSVCSSTFAFTVHEPAITFFATQLDVAAALIKEGAEISPQQLATILAQKGLSLFGFAPDGHWRCAAAMSVLVINASALTVSSAAIPATAGATTAEAMVDAYALVASVYESYGECKPIADELLVKADQGTLLLEYRVRQWIKSM